MGISNENKNIFTDFFDHLTPANLEEPRKCLRFFLKKNIICNTAIAEMYWLSENYLFWSV